MTISMQTIVTGYRYIIHFYCRVVEAGFYSDVLIVSACRSSIPDYQNHEICVPSKMNMDPNGNT